MKKYGMIILCLLAVFLSVQGKKTVCIEAKSISINDQNFPDIYFQEYVMYLADTNEDGKLSDSERNAITKIDVGGASEYQMDLEYLPVESLKGIEYFTQLKELNCSDSVLSELDVSKNTKLVELRCNNNQIKKLNLTKNRQLARLYCQDNKLKTLSCNKNRKLTELYCARNQIKKITVSQNTKLTELSVSGNKIKRLNVSPLKNLTKLYASENRLTKLTVSGNPKLTELFVQDNALRKLSVKKNKQLDTLLCNKNRIRKLDLGSNRLLQVLCCEKNQLLMGNRNIAYTTLTEVTHSGQSARLKVKKTKNGYLVPLKGKDMTNVLSKLSKGEITKKGILIKGKKLPKKITYQYNMFTDGNKKTKVTIYLKK